MLSKLSVASLASNELQIHLPLVAFCAQDSCDKDAVVNHAVVLVGYGKSKSENKDIISMPLPCRASWDRFIF